MGTGPNHRGEISRIADDVFINYALGLPDTEMASTSGYFMKGPPVRYSYFTIERGASTLCEQTTAVHVMDTMTGEKQGVLATVTWSSNCAQDMCLGLITGYDPPSALPAGWALLGDPYPFYPCYLSMTSIAQPGLGHNHDNDTIDIHSRRITELPAAMLALHLPAGTPTDKLKVFLYQHKHAAHGAAPAVPQAEEVACRLNRSTNSLMIGSHCQPLQMGLYVVARSAESVYP